MSMEFCPHCDQGVWYGVEHRCPPVVSGTTTTLTNTSAAIAEITGGGEQRRVTQYGIRMGDGEVPDIYSNRQDAAERLKTLRWHVENDPEYDAEDYEPMSIVSRSHAVLMSPWVEVKA